MVFIRDAHYALALFQYFFDQFHSSILQIQFPQIIWYVYLPGIDIRNPFGDSTSPLGDGTEKSTFALQLAAANSTINNGIIVENLNRDK